MLARNQPISRYIPNGSLNLIDFVQRFILMQRLQLTLVLFLSIASTSLALDETPPARLPTTTPEEVGLNISQLERIDRLVADEIEKKNLPGCVVLIGRQGAIAFARAYGHRQLEPTEQPMTLETVFDLASLTKPVATATSIMILVERGEVRLRDPVAKYIPEFGQNGKDKITLEHLLTHQGGLIPDNPLSDYQDGSDEAWKRIWALKPKTEIGKQFIYTDVGFLVLGEIVHRTTGQNVAQFASENIFQPLGMEDTGFLPRPELRNRVAPTEQRDGQWLRGEVHDPRAALLGGVAGHAGLFSSASDLALYANMMLSQGTVGDARVLSPQTIAEMTRQRDIAGRLRALGWDVRSKYSSNRGEIFSPRAFGHGGFTGTAMWIDPELDLFVIFLSSRLHPDGVGSVNDLAGRIGTVAASAITRNAQVTNDDRSQDSLPVMLGIDVLERDKYRVLQNRRVGLITNHTGLNRRGIRTIDLLHASHQVELVSIFSPEHGLQGKLDVSEIADTRDEATNLPVRSLYGKMRRPEPEHLEGLDTLVFDIQDIGTRFYTYMSTMGLAMEAAAEHGLRFVVLDRPNPIGGMLVEGPLLDPGKESFVGYHPISVRHGMTIGELARMFREERGLELDLQVVPIEHWRRQDYWDATGLVWTNPSPNMRSLAQ
ncbi:MAG: exo-beta-N-acetylmuramidase NamZ domain-containing protein, partial [Aeoliella sp.]